VCPNKLQTLLKYTGNFIRLIELPFIDREIFFFCLFYSHVFVRGGCGVNTDYVKAPIFPDLVVNFPDFSPIFLQYFPILCKLDNLT